MEGGTLLFPDLGKHCQNPDCHQLDFLPFTCNSCHKVFCLEHRSHKSHDCPKSDIDSRKVVVCEICSASIETTGHDREEEKNILERHEKSGDCDPKRKKKPGCPVRKCKEVLTFSNSVTCKVCEIKVCLKHRFPNDHACKPTGIDKNKFLVALAARNGKDCGKKVVGSNMNTPTVKAC